MRRSLYVDCWGLQDVQRKVHPQHLQHDLHALLFGSNPKSNISKSIKRIDIMRSNDEVVQLIVEAISGRITTLFFEDIGLNPNLTAT